MEESEELQRRIDQLRTGLDGEKGLYFLDIEVMDFAKKLLGAYFKLNGREQEFQEDRCEILIWRTIIDERIQNH